MCASSWTRPFNVLRSRKGFTLVEALVNVAVAVIVVAGAHMAYVHSIRGARDQQSNINSKTLASQIISMGVGSGSYIPPMTSTSGSFAYVSCYNQDGIATKNSMGTTGMVMVTKPLKDSPSGFCSPGARFEARIFAKAPPRLTVQIWEFTPSSSKGSFIIATEREYDPPEDL